MQPKDPNLNPSEFFAFLGEHDDYPVSGAHLATQAREDGAEPELVEFLQALPGTINDESQVVKHAMEPDEAPFGKQLDLSSAPDGQNPNPDPATRQTLKLNDIIPPPES